MRRLAHERHPLLIVLPVAAVLVTLVTDFVFVFTGEERWWLVARPILTIGLAGLVAAIVAGMVDLRAEPEPARSVEVAYVGLDLTVLLSLATSTWLRWVMPVPEDATPGVGWSVINGLLLVGCAWLAATLVRLHHHQEPLEPT